MIIQEEISEIQEFINTVTNCDCFILSHTQFGYTESVSLHIFQYQMDIEVKLWNSENEEREWIEEKNEYEDFTPFLKRKINDCLHSFTELKSIFNEE
jgi:hypothetical protein